MKQSYLKMIYDIESEKSYTSVTCLTIKWEIQIAKNSILIDNQLRRT